MSWAPDALKTWAALERRALPLSARDVQAASRAVAGTIAKLWAHRNNVGCLRLLFASLVIFGHAPEILDGNRAREPLTVIFHTVSLGELSVDAFFLISGYLITRSMERAPNVFAYLERRVLRIYPAFIVASIVSVFGLGVMLGAEPWRFLPKTLLRMALLLDPMRYPVAGGGSLTPALNGSMWTIIYEFRCYLLIAALGVTGLLKRRRLMAGLTLAALAASIWATFPAPGALLARLGRNGLLVALLGSPYPTLKLTAAFLAGSQFQLWREEVLPRLNGAVAAISLAAAGLLLYRDPHFAEAGLASFGAAALFWLALKADIGPFQRINDRWDISYGVYLYGWPAALVILSFIPSISPLTLAFASLALALFAGACSWWGVEKRTKDLVVIRQGPPTALPAPNVAPAIEPPG